MSSSATGHPSETAARTDREAEIRLAAETRDALRDAAARRRAHGRPSVTPEPRLPVSLKVFVAAVAAIGAVALAASAPDGLGGRPGLAVALIAGALFSAAFPIRFPGLRFEANAAHPFVFCALAVAGPFAAAATDLAGVLGTALGRGRAPRPVHLVFNVGLVAVSTTAAWQAWAAVGGTAASGLRERMFAILVAGTVYYVINVVLLGIAVSLEMRRPLVALVRRSIGLTVTPFFAGVLLAAVMVPALEFAIAVGLVFGLASAGALIGMLRAVAAALPDGSDTA